MDKPAVLLVLHDVAGETWADYAPFVAAVDALGEIPMTLLVVPDFHRRNPLDQDPALRAILDQRVARGDELTLHGLYHADAQARMRSPRDWFMRRVYTWEGEFYDLDRQQALSRLHTGIELFDRHGWPLDGFVAPAWRWRSCHCVTPAIIITCIGCPTSRRSPRPGWSGAPAVPGAAVCRKR